MSQCAGWREESASQLNPCGTPRASWRSSTLAPSRPTTTTSWRPTTMYTLGGRLRPNISYRRREDMKEQVEEVDQRRSKEEGGRRRTSEGKEKKQRSKEGKKREGCKRLGLLPPSPPPPPPSPLPPPSRHHPPPISRTPPTLPRPTFLSSWCSYSQYLNLCGIWCNMYLSYVSYIYHIPKTWTFSVQQIWKWKDYEIITETSEL